MKSPEQEQGSDPGLELFAIILKVIFKDVFDSYCISHGHFIEQ